MAKSRKRRRWVVYSLVFVGFVLFGATLGAIAAFLRSTPSLDDITFDPMLTTYIYDANGEVLTRLWKQNRVPVTIDQIPAHVRHAAVAIEDHRFYQHHGFDLIRIMGSLIADIKSRRIVAGGSTITQQLAKNAFFTHEQKWSRKVQELLWAIQIERKYSKDEILEKYLNEIYFGHGAYGVEAAAETYFGKHVWELNLPEAAMIVGVTNGPGYFSPFIDMDAAKRRRDTVLYRMFELGYITESEYRTARDTPIEVVRSQPREEIASYFIEYVIAELIERYGEEKVLAGGLRIYTTLDREMQRTAEQTLLSSLPKGEKDSNGITQPQAALVSVDPRTGEIKAMVGGRGDKGDKFNRAVYAVRQPGSAIKPFLYIVALQQGWTPATIIVDEPLQYTLPNGRVWNVRNYHNDYRGAMTLREAVELSINVIAVKVLEQVGVKPVMDMAEKMGISSLVHSGEHNDRGLSQMALGGLTRGVTPLEMASAFGVLANQGIRVEPYAIAKVTEADGTVLEEARPRKSVVLDEEVAYMMTDLLRGVIERGTAKSANIGRPAAGKTGTSQDYTNGWFVGYTPELSTAIWLGNDRQSEEMVYNGVRYGSWNAAAIWGDYMRKVMQGRPITNFTKPDGIVEGILIDTKTGLLAKANAGIPEDELRYEIFIKGTEPTEESPRMSTGLERATDLLKGLWYRLLNGGSTQRPPKILDEPESFLTDPEEEAEPDPSPPNSGETGGLPEGFYWYLDGDI